MAIESELITFMKFMADRDEKRECQRQEEHQQQMGLLEKVLSLHAESRLSQDVNVVKNVPGFSAFSGTEKEDWEPYLCRLNQHFEAHRVESEDQKRAYFLSWVGNDTFNLLRKLFGSEDVSKQSYTDIVKQLSDYFKSTTHVLAARYRFNKTVMKPSQSYAGWVADLRGVARDCNFICTGPDCEQSSVDEHIRDMIVLHTPHDHVRTVALQSVNPSLEDVLKVAEIYESTQQAKKSLAEEISPDICKISSNYKKSKSAGNRSFSDSNPNYGKSCPDCKVKHERFDCRFYKLKIECNKCGKKGHIASVCYASSRNKNKFTKRNASNENTAAKNKNNAQKCRDENVNTVQNIDENGLRYFINVQINGVSMRMMIDTGATCSIVGLHEYKMLGTPKLHALSTQLKAYGDFGVKVKGWLPVEVKVGSKTHTLRLIVADSETQLNIFGTPWFKAFGYEIKDSMDSELVNAIEIEQPQNDVQMEYKSKIDELCKKYSTVFEEGLGCCKTFEASLYLKEGAVPKFFKPRPVPFSQTEVLKKELDRLLEAGIIKPIKTSQWAAPIVIVPKADGSSIRVCGDFKVTVNPQLSIEQYPIPRVEELFHKLKSGKYFSKIDLADAYLQLSLDDNAKKLTVINTPFGLFQYQRLAFGIASAPAIFQCFIEQVIAGLPGCANYLDDIIASGESAEEHLQVLEKLFERLEAYGLKCKLSKCEFFQKQVEYLGNILSEQGIRPSDSGIEAIRNLPQPKDINQLQSFIGKVNYYNRFIPNFAELCAPLNALRKKNACFHWGKEQQNAFLKLKEHIIDATKLVHYRDDYPVILATDASAYGIGAVLSHRYPDGTEHPLAFASKTLNSHERAYSQIEKEALSIIFGVKKFHQYLYGRSFELLTDHKPLISIFNPSKKLPVYTLARLQRWAITLMSYNFVIKYRSTDKHKNADALSRLPVGPDFLFDKSEESMECYQITSDINEDLTCFPVDSQKVCKETKKNKLLCKVLNYVEQGWPSDLPDNEKELQPFFARRLALTMHNGVLIWQSEYSRVVVPPTLQGEVLKMLHVGHWGVVRMKQMARRYCWWPGIDKDIETLSRKCDPCQTSHSNPPREFSSWPKPDHPWQRVHIDFAGPFWDSMWLIIIDSYSKFPYVVKMVKTTAENTVDVLKKVFLLEGPPDTLVSDNGTQFTSHIFQEFCTKNGIQHLTSAPFHPSSNGEAERFVRTFKNSMKKTWCEGVCDKSIAYDKFLFSYRTTPNPVTGKSPAELLHGRQPRTSLDMLSPHKKVVEEEPKQKIPKFNRDDQVYVKFFGRKNYWLPGVIKANLGRVMYEISTSKGLVRRHQNQIKRKFSDYISEGQDCDSNESVITPQLSETAQSSKENADCDPVKPISDSQADLPGAVSSSSPTQVTNYQTPRRSTRIRRPVNRYSP